MTTQTRGAATAEKVGEAGKEDGFDISADSAKETVVDERFTVGAVASAAKDRPAGVHGFGISYAGELPKIAIPQVVQMTEFHNRPA